MKDKTTLFSYRYSDYFRKWSYNGWNRTPGADVLAGDFDGDGETEMVVIFQGDFPSGERNVMMFGGTVKTLHMRTDSIHLTISTIPNVTRAGQYAFTVQISEDGETWTDKEALIFGTEDSGSFGGVSASSGGCDVGYSAVMLMLLVLGIRRKIHNPSVS